MTNCFGCERILFGSFSCHGKNFLFSLIVAYLVSFLDKTHYLISIRYDKENIIYYKLTNYYKPKYEDGLNVMDKHFKIK